jgi:hypothetical protein
VPDEDISKKQKNSENINNKIEDREKSAGLSFRRLERITAYVPERGYKISNPTLLAPLLESIGVFFT